MARRRGRMKDDDQWRWSVTLWCSPENREALKKGAAERGESVAALLLRAGLAEVGGPVGENYDYMLEGVGEVADALRELVKNRGRSG